MRSWVARQDNIPRGRTIPMGAVPVEARGLRHMVPTYTRRRPDHRSTAVSAPRFVRLTMFFGSATFLELDQRRSESAAAPRGPRPAGSGRAHRQPRSQQPPRRGRIAPRAPLASSNRFGVSPVARRAEHAPAFDRACRRRICDRPARSRWPGIAAHLSPLASRGADSAGAMSIREPLEAAPVVDPDLLFVPLACFDRRGHRIGYGAGYYDRTLRKLRATKPVHAVGVAHGVCEVEGCLTKLMTRAWTPL